MVDYYGVPVTLAKNLTEIMKFILESFTTSYTTPILLSGNKAAAELNDSRLSWDEKEVLQKTNSLNFLITYKLSLFMHEFDIARYLLLFKYKILFKKKKKKKCTRV